MAEDEGPATLTVAVLNGALGTSVNVSLSTIDGSAIGIEINTCLYLLHVVYYILSLLSFF